MTASQYDFSVTRDTIIRRALRIVGALPLGNSPSADEQSNASEVLNELVKNWQSRDVFLWSIVEKTVVLTPGTATYVVSTDPPVIDVDRAFIRDAQNGDVDLRKISYLNYQSIPQKDSSGKPTDFVVIPTIIPSFIFYPVPDTALTIHYFGIAKLQDMDNTSDNPNIPTRFIKPLIYGLAADLADDYKLPMQERQMLAGKAEGLFLAAKASDRDTDEEEFIESSYEK